MLNVTYPFQAIRGLNNLDFTGYEKIQPNFAFWPFGKFNEGPLSTPKQYFLICMCSPNCYLPIPCQLNHLDFSSYNKIQPDVAHF